MRKTKETGAGQATMTLHHPEETGAIIDRKPANPPAITDPDRPRTMEIKNRSQKAY